MSMKPSTRKNAWNIRYLDLRRPEMQQTFGTRYRVTKIMRDYLGDLGFWEIETPFLTKSTPEGGRDFIVPSRFMPGSFYALPQSPAAFQAVADGRRLRQIHADRPLLPR